MRLPPSQRTVTTARITETKCSLQELLLLGDLSGKLVQITLRLLLLPPPPLPVRTLHRPPLPGVTNVQFNISGG